MTATKTTLARRNKSRARTAPRPIESATGVLLFETRFGWTAMRVSERTIERLQFGSTTPREALNRLEASTADVVIPATRHQAWIDRIVEFCDGAIDTLTDLPIDESRFSPFQRAVTRACRKIPYGQTMSYGQLGEKVGSPRAARAVGNVMRQNPFPLIVPCHRVVAANGLGGYSGSRGISTKRKLLNLESESVRRV